MKDRWNIKICFSTLSDMYADLPAIVKKISQYGKLSADREYDLRLILSELTINALEHGLPPVSISAGRCCCGDIHILISHEEPVQKFDPCEYFQSVPDPENERGRGIFLAYCLADGLAYNSSATKALLKVRCTEIAV